VSSHGPGLIRSTLGWLEERFAAQGTTTEEIVRLEHHRQGAMNVTVRNIITSMRLMSNFDWKEFFESISRVDEVLRAGTDFATLDFPTRDRYRHAIEDLARGSRCSEVEVACRVVARTKEAAAANDPGHERRHDPGYHLLSQGRAALEHELEEIRRTGWAQSSGEVDRGIWAAAAAIRDSASAGIGASTRFSISCRHSASLSGSSRIVAAFSLPPPQPGR